MTTKPRRGAVAFWVREAATASSPAIAEAMTDLMNRVGAECRIVSAEVTWPNGRAVGDALLVVAWERSTTHR